MSTETIWKINNLTSDEMLMIYPYLSRDDRKKQQQIKFINSNSSLSNSIKDSDKNINDDEIAKSLYDLRKVDSLTPLVAKFTINETKFFDKNTDALGTSILNGMDQLMNWTESNVDSMINSLESMKESAIDAKRKYIDRTVSPVSSWATKKLSSLSSSFVDDLHSFNKKVSQNRLINIPGDMFNSMRHIAFALKGNLEKLVDFTHQIFAGISAMMFKLRRLIRKLITAITKILVSLIESLIPTDFLTNIANSVNEVLLGLGESVGTFINQIGFDTTTNLFEGLTQEITSFAEAPLTYALGELNIQSYINIPGQNSLRALEQKITQPLETIIRFADTLTIENLIKLLPKDAQKLIATLNEIATNAKGFVGNGVRSWARKNILKGKNELFLGKMNGLGVRFTLSTPYHFTGPSNRGISQTVPYITFKKLLTYNGSNSFTVDGYGNKVGYLSYTQRNLF
jgi:hypothetical protein